MATIHHLHRGKPFTVIESPRPDYSGPRYFSPSLYRSLDESARIAAVIADCERDRRHFRNRRIVTACCLAIALFCIAYFGGQELRAVLS